MLSVLARAGLPEVEGASMDVEDPERVCHPEEPDARNAVSAERFVGRLVDVACNGSEGIRHRHAPSALRARERGSGRREGSE